MTPNNYSKGDVALHEAGHVAIAIACGIGELITEVKIHKHSETGLWGGHVMWNPAPHQSYIEKIKRVASSFGGPVTQSNLCQTSFSGEVQALIAKEGTILGAIEAVLEDKLNLETEWYDDFREFICAVKLPFADLRGYYSIEGSNELFLKEPKALQLIGEIAKLLEDRETIGPSDLVPFLSQSWPPIPLPSRLPVPYK